MYVYTCYIYFDINASCRHNRHNKFFSPIILDIHLHNYMSPNEIVKIKSFILP